MHQKTVFQTRAALADHQQQLGDATVIGNEELAALKIQQRILAVDLAGAQSQLEAAAKLLFNRNRLSPARIEQLECVKTATEIELARLSGRQKILDSLITQAERQRTNNELEVAQNPPVRPRRSSSDLAPPVAAPETGIELLNYCEALCAGDLKLHARQQVPPAPLSREHPGASPSPAAATRN